MDLTQLVADARKRLDLPVHLARGLPNACYTDHDFFRLEQERIFGRHWTAVGVGAEIPNPGDVKPVEVAGRPVLLVRDKAGAVRAFHNVCSHRGMTLYDKPCQGQAALRCPYHSWAYGLDGKLRATPYVGGPHQNSHPDFDKSDKGLKPVRVAMQWDIVFVDLSGQAPELSAWLAPIAERWAGYDLSQMRHGALADSTGRFELKANWKLAMENFCESYHLPWIHPGLNSYSRLEDHYHIFGEHLFAGQGSTKYAPVQSGNGVFPTFPGIAPERAAHAEYLAVLPNFWLGLQIDHFYVVILDAVAPDRVVETMHLYYLGDAATDDTYGSLRQRNSELWSQVFLEDVGVVEGMQRGRRSPAFDGGAFSPAMDTPTLHFHRMVAGAL